MRLKLKNREVWFKESCLNRALGRYSHGFESNMLVFIVTFCKVYRELNKSNSKMWFGLVPLRFGLGRVHLRECVLTRATLIREMDRDN